jgi:hypothetical protein
MNTNAICNAPTYGWDPECFLSVNSQTLPLGGILPGTKARPFRITAEGDPDEAGEYAISEDGVCLETNTPVTTSPKEAVASLLHSFVAARNFIQRHQPFTQWVPQQRKLSASTWQLIEQGYCETQHRSGLDFGNSLFNIPQAFVVGCEPDYNAYTCHAKGGDPNSSINKRLDISEFGGIRFAGCHIHIGYPTARMPAHVLAVFCDLISTYCGLRDSSTRGSYYGQMGNFRYKPYGIEYRSMGGAAVLRELELLKFVTGVHNLLAMDINEVRAVWAGINVLDIQQRLASYQSTGMETFVQKLMPAAVTPPLRFTVTNTAVVGAPDYYSEVV